MGGDVFRITPKIMVIAILLVGFVVSWASTYSIRNDKVYRSVHDMGYRFSTIVPHGKDIGPAGFDAQYVRVEPAMYYKKPPVLSEPLPVNTKPLDRFKAGREEHLIIPAVGMMVVVLALISVLAFRPDMRAAMAHDRGLMLSKLTGALTLIAVVSIAGMMLYRLFLTGVDDGLIARASTVSDSGHVFHFAQQTLAMSYASLMMLYTGVGLATYLVLVWFGLRMMALDQVRQYPRENSSWDKLNSRPITLLRFAAYAFLVSINLVLILAPWSTTIWGLLIDG
jgi:hypothetical protein